MRFLGSKISREKNMEKNILILGLEGCGKRSLVLHYKDGDTASDHDSDSFKTISYLKQFPNTNERILLNFVLNRSSDEMIPSISHKKIKYDLVLIVTDVSSPTSADDLSFYSQYADTHFPGVATLAIGSKSDLADPEANFDHLLLTSAKTGDGFDILDAQLKEHLIDSDTKRHTL